MLFTFSGRRSILTYLNGFVCRHCKLVVLRGLMGRAAWVCLSVGTLECLRGSCPGSRGGGSHRPGCCPLPTAGTFFAGLVPGVLPAHPWVHRNSLPGPARCVRGGPRPAEPCARGRGVQPSGFRPGIMGTFRWITQAESMILALRPRPTPPLSCWCVAAAGCPHCPLLGPMSPVRPEPVCPGEGAERAWGCSRTRSGGSPGPPLLPGAP